MARLLLFLFLMLVSGLVQTAALAAERLAVLELQSDTELTAGQLAALTRRS